MQQFCRGAALSTYNSNVTQLCRKGKTSDVADAKKAVDDYNDADPNMAAQLAQALTDAEANTQDQHLLVTDAGDRAHMASTTLNKMMTSLLTNKVLQHAKRYLRCEARKPFDMNVKSYYINIMRIDSEEISCLPPHFSEAQSLAEGGRRDYGHPPPRNAQELAEGDGLTRLWSFDANSSASSCVHGTEWNLRKVWFRQKDNQGSYL